jgi:hypothetical protein
MDGDWCPGVADVVGVPEVPHGRDHVSVAAVDHGGVHAAAGFYGRDMVDGRDAVPRVATSPGDQQAAVGATDDDWPAGAMLTVSTPSNSIRPVS